MSITEMSGIKIAKIFTKKNAEIAAAVAIAGMLGSVLAEDKITGEQSLQACEKVEMDFANAAKFFQKSGLASQTGNATVTIERQLTDKDVDLFLPWSTHKTCRISLTLGM